MHFVRKTPGPESLHGMKASNPYWREAVVARMPRHLVEEIDAFETEITLRKQGKIDERIFAETRLRRGAYGQRYDNGHRNDGKRTRTLKYPCDDLTKGPSTVWDAPGMLRIKIPYGGTNAEQLEVMAELAEEYSDGIAHVTTRQDWQLHFIHLDDTPSIMRRLAAVGITTREACGNSVRNVTACPCSGVCPTEAFDVTPYAHALTYFLMGHPDCQDFGRKFKPAFSGCKDKACGLVNMHDLGFIATTRQENGTTRRGFEMYVGGGLGAAPRQAKLLSDFVTEEEILPLSQAVARVFGRLGEKKNRARARIKFLVEKLGIGEFRRLVLEERKVLAADERWTAYLKNIQWKDEQPLRTDVPATETPQDSAYQEWRSTNVQEQRQKGFYCVEINLPLGDITSDQLRDLADICRKFVGDTIRTTVEQNLLLRWVNEADLPSLYQELKEAHLASVGAGTIIDITACPGTDTCKLGTSSSRGLAGELRNRLSESYYSLDEAIKGLKIKVSGCFNSCGQHHVADLGFFGVGRNFDGHTVPHFQVVVGGQWADNAGSYGLGICAVPSKNIPETVDRLTRAYLKDHQNGERFNDYVERVGKVHIKDLISDLTRIPKYAEDPSYYSDWSDPREYTKEDIGVGECAGEVVSSFAFDMMAAERLVFEAQVALEKKDAAEAARLARDAMLTGAVGMLKLRLPNPPRTNDETVARFCTLYVDTAVFFDPYAGPKFANYFLDAWANREEAHTVESAHTLIEESALFVEACHSCHGRMTEKAVPA